MKKILINYPNFERGGVKLNFINITKALNQLNCSITLLSDQVPNEIKNFKKINFILIKSKKNSFINHKIISSLISIKYLIKFFIKNRKKDFVVFSFQSSFFISIICYVFRIKLIVRISEDPIDATLYADKFFSSVIVLISKILTYNLSNILLVNSKKMKRSTNILLVNKKKTKILYNMNLEKETFFLNKKKKLFLNVGRFCKQKNQLYLLYLFKEFLKIRKDYKLLIIGDGPDKKKMTSFCKNNKMLNNVIIMGWKNNLKKYYLESKFYISTSLYEGLPNALIDALNYSLVAISSKTSGIEDIYSKNIISLNQKNLNQDVEKINFAINNYKNYYLKIKKFREKKLKKFSKELLMDNIKNILQKI